ncbi:hypothetical protein NSE01_24170 [Novosphingobium sediminis]|uniref:Uncharacterized protein n=1 Tax=Novosphingobium sediminis TaxID=707214 RepID=A0A512ALJ9_9SPHN|nr:hypothetical protein NSE01_24170 [Novosphingobium sediminis]
MPRKQIGAALIISSALVGSRHARYRWLVVEEADAFAVLALMIFHDEAKSRIKAIDRQWLSVTTPIWISGQKRKAMLPDGLQPDNCVAEIEHVLLVANCGFGSAHYSL